jgi:3-oxoacyl-[acyl-carrier protein] reductase
VNLNGRIAVVTGAAGTLGNAAVRALLEEGAQVALVDVDAMRLDGLVRFLRGPTVAVSCDVADPGAVRQAQVQVEKVMGPVDILVNAAAAGSDSRAEATTDAEWRRVMTVNVDGAFYWARAVLPSMRKRGWGRVINVSSLAGRPGAPNAGAAYAIANGALAGLTTSLARECAAHGVTVNGIAPAYVKSPTVTEHLNDSQRRMLLAQVPAGRFCEPEEFAHAVRFLASPLASFITGEVIGLNGGARL